MQAGTRIGLGIGLAAGAVVAGGVAAAVLASRRDEPIGGHATSPGDEPMPVEPDYPIGGPVPAPYPGGPGTSPGDEPLRMPVSGHIDPPAWFDDYTFDGDLDRARLDVTIDPRGWWNDIGVRGSVDGGGWNVTIDPPGWGGNVHVDGRRTAGGYDGSVDRPGLWNDVDHPIRETIRGAQVHREGRFDETLVPSFSEVKWRSAPADTHGGARLLEFDPPGWGNTTRVTLDGNPPAGVEAAIAAHLFHEWKTELERQAEYPDPGYPDPTGPGDDPGYPTSPGDDGGYDPTWPDPGYPTSPGDDGGWTDPGYPTSPGDDHPAW